jgi:hypothetical protein
VADRSAVLLYIWSFTNPKCGMAGVYACKRRALCDGRLTGTQLDKGLAQLREGKFMFYVQGWLWVRSRVTHLSAINGNIARSIRKDVLALPGGHPFIDAFRGEYGDDGRLLKGLKEGKVDFPHE